MQVRRVYIPLFNAPDIHLPDKHIFTVQEHFYGDWNSLSIAMSAPSQIDLLPPGTASNYSGFYVLSRVVIAIGRDKAECIEHLQTRDWEAIDALLAGAAQLLSIEFVCGSVLTHDEFEGLVDEVRSRLRSISSRVYWRRDRNMDDSRGVSPEMFGQAWRNWYNEETATVNA